MIFNICKTCEECEHGDIRDERSHCAKESMYSHLTRCIGKQALELFIQHDAKSVKQTL